MLASGKIKNNKINVNKLIRSMVADIRKQAGYFLVATLTLCGELDGYMAEIIVRRSLPAESVPKKVKRNNGRRKVERKSEK